MKVMTIGTSTVLVAAGAIMRFAVSAKGSGFSVHTVGLILMIVGLAGALLSLAVFAISGRGTTTSSGAPGTVIVEQHSERQERPQAQVR
jgi:hypothetical protein